MKDSNRNNVDAEEIARFEASSAFWWDRQGPLRTLHTINPLRFDWIHGHSPVTGKRVLDVGCGGGILAETLCENGALVTGIDASDAAIETAKSHSRQENLNIDYLCTTAEEMAEQRAESFELVTCLEMLEHVPDPQATVQAIARLTRPGCDIVFSTINRNLFSWLTVIVGGEHILGLLPKGTHSYDKLIKPSELAGFCRNCGLEVRHIQGMVYNPLTHSASLASSVDANYLLHCTRPLD